jgi:5-methylcytosine-specific restriction endonuclease McrA
VSDSKSHPWYDLQSWRRRRRHQLATEPLCRFCLTEGRITPARVADHVIPHNGDWNKFVLGELQSLCVDCHDRVKRHVELYGFRHDVGVDGWPLDPNHPTNRKGT